MIKGLSIRCKYSKFFVLHVNVKGFPISVFVYTRITFFTLIKHYYKFSWIFLKICILVVYITSFKIENTSSVLFP